MRLFRAFWMVVLIVGCAGGPGGPPGRAGAPGGGSLQATLAARLSYMLAAARGLVAAPDGGRIAWGALTESQPLSARWRRAEATLYLRPEGPRAPDARFFFPAVGAREVDITLFALHALPGPARVSCDGPARLIGGAGGSTGWTAAGQVLPLKIQTGALQNPHLVLSPAVTTCRMGWGAGRRLVLVREDLAKPEVAALDRRQEVCAAPEPARLDPLAQVFYADRWLMQSCAQPLGQVRLLPDPLDALNARIEALTGARLSRAALMSGDPMQKLDFSRAPKLDLIYVSYLHVRADYSGYLMARMLAWHARRGAIVRILVTDRLMEGPEKRLMQGLAAQYPGVQIQFFEWRKPGGRGAAYPLNHLQRAQHIKVFATLARTPGRSRFITGGRNIHDGFFFDRPFDLSAWPFLRSYKGAGGLQGVNFYATYEDFEVELSDDRAVRAGMALLSGFWHRDGPSQVPRPVAANGAPGHGGGQRAGVVRFFQSVPWADGQAQERFYVELIDAARREIVLVTPYMYPPPAIEVALARARARGVRVMLVTRLASQDPPAVFVETLTRDFLTRWAGAIEIYQYDAPGTMALHTKLVLIDGRLAVVSSTNLNRRSFVHDTENGIVVLDADLTARIRQVVEHYVAEGTPVQRSDTRPDFLTRLFRDIPWLKQFL